ncbi:hypothetical protein GCM10020358_19630 [Amorphoplanes nipponensis]|uniref:Uncharacterized protein n=1 Tax=Actinoplanes nipponensis TaxID=135950 RepID=A0A919JCW0_9ACTN|nr:hypothetical protein Ani05nite_22080 [Actinoplanes nipponensis]
MDRRPLRLLLSGPASATPHDATTAGRNRIHLVVDDLDTEIDRLRAAGLAFRSELVPGPAAARSRSPTPPAISSNCSNPPATPPLPTTETPSHFAATPACHTRSMVFLAAPGSVRLLRYSSSPAAGSRSGR